MMLSSAEKLGVYFWQLVRGLGNTGSPYPSHQLRSFAPGSVPVKISVSPAHIIPTWISPGSQQKPVVFTRHHLGWQTLNSTVFLVSPCMCAKAAQLLYNSGDST